MPAAGGTSLELLTIPGVSQTGGQPGSVCGTRRVAGNTTVSRLTRKWENENANRLVFGEWSDAMKRWGDEDEEAEELGLKDRASLIILFLDEKRSLAEFET